jgi:hypothetical protein
MTSPGTFTSMINCIMVFIHREFFLSRQDHVIKLGSELPGVWGSLLITMGFSRKERKAGKGAKIFFSAGIYSLRNLHPQQRCLNCF